MSRCLLALVGMLVHLPSILALPLEAGAAAADITPPTGFPMWGYASRKDKPSEGVLEPLRARALVLAAGENKIAIVSLDLGRPPTRQSTARIRESLRKDGITEIFLVASHTHHGPVLELDSWPTPARPYTRELEDKLVALVRKSDAGRVPARYGVASTETMLNRNRQSKQPNPPVDNSLTVLRFEDRSGKPIATLVNFAAHPTMLPAELMKFAPDYPGAMAAAVEARTGAPCLFLQGAAGDLSPRSPEDIKGPEAFGKRLAAEVLKLADTIRPAAEPRESVNRIATAREELRFTSAVDVSNPQVRHVLGRAFFPELVTHFEREYRDGVRPTVTAAVLDGTIGLAGVSGELFCEHAIGLRRRARLDHVIVLGYCNDYHQYFPTIQAAAEGGYGTVPPMAAAEVGAGERLADAGLTQLYRLRGKLPDGK